MSKNRKRGRPPLSSEYRQHDDVALERMHPLVVSKRMPVRAAARKVAYEMKSPGADPVERLRHAYFRRRDEIGARIASRAEAQEPQAETSETALSRQFRMFEEARRHAISFEAARRFVMSPEAEAAHRFVMSPEGQAQVRRAKEEFERILQMGLLSRPPWS